MDDRQLELDVVFAEVALVVVKAVVDDHPVGVAVPIKLFLIGREVVVGLGRSRNRQSSDCRCDVCGEFHQLNPLSVKHFLLAALY